MDYFEDIGKWPIKFKYTNWRGEKADRRALIRAMRFGSSEWHKEPQWLMIGEDLDKGEDREFAAKDMTEVSFIDGYFC